jgi:pimeloyl-ACP methyl ester carboxylesterase
VSSAGEVEIEGQRIEYRWSRASNDETGSPIVLLHEGLGCVSLWKEFPAALAESTARDVLAYSRQGYGQSSPIGTKREPDYMHREALDILPKLRAALDIENCILVGHSDGASIALIHAGARRWPVSAAVVLAPHVFVESISLKSIALARDAYETTDLRTRLARHHADPDSAFRGWSDIWLDARFEQWNIEAYLPHIGCPVLAIQGHDDEYGSMEQIHRLVRAIDFIEVLKLEACGHSPHRDHPKQVLRAIKDFLAATGV